MTKIKETLGKSWNGTAVNGTPYTQWMASEEFFNLWKISKDQIKQAGFSLYKHETLGWVVTLFGVSEGDYESYDIYKKDKDNEILKRVKMSFIDHIRGYDGRVAFDTEELVEEVEACGSLSEVRLIVEREMDNPDYVWGDL